MGFPAQIIPGGRVLRRKLEGGEGSGVEQRKNPRKDVVSSEDSLVLEGALEPSRHHGFGPPGICSFTLVSHWLWSVTGGERGQPSPRQFQVRSTWKGFDKHSSWGWNALALGVVATVSPRANNNPLASLVNTEGHSE